MPKEYVAILADRKYKPYQLGKSDLDNFIDSATANSVYITIESKDDPYLQSMRLTRKQVRQMLEDMDLQR